MQIEQLKPIVEAALLAASQPMTISQLGDLFAETDEVGHEQIARALEALAADCEGRGVELKEIASGFRYQVRQDVHPWISRMWTEKPSRYSRALLETLALIAYRQPITRPEIEQIRGVVVSSNIVKTLEEREWIRVVGYRDVPGKPALFGTTRAFLDYFNLKSLDQLPPLSEIRDMEDPQMGFDQTPLPARVIKDLPIDPDEEIGEEVPAEDAAAEVAEAAPATNTHEVPQHEADAAAADTEAAASAADADEASTHNEPEPATADEAAAPADVEDDTAAQNS
ncbi:SMC-Scp complex subunit ScpB [Rhodanobacter sp. C06]|uniref:SMC-Scp complex subunit ScpB n=1 Tax=Rhodanobacter sp. C06 TaxID=1945854 RepID=UPI00111550FC|nr:SMC-Scp complex subunit ScpB [Rhodanobacter sp. C06]